jgi:hypothetical protein
MNIHSKIQIQLYDYLHDELNEEEKAVVQNHLQSCPVCGEALNELSLLVEKFSHFTLPSDDRDQEYWKNFVYKIETKLADKHAKSFFTNIIDTLYSLFVVQKRTTIAFSTTIVVALVVVGLFYNSNYSKKYSKQPQVVAAERDTTMINERIGKYFRKSKTLLVGLTNLELNKNRSLDLNTEQEISHELIKEARYLRQHPIDIQSAELMRDMDDILIKLSSIRSGSSYSDFENIRQGIYRDNLMFKIRMAENAFYPVTRR